MSSPSVEEVAQDYMKKNFRKEVRIIKDANGREFVLVHEVSIPPGFKVSRTLRVDKNS